MKINALTIAFVLLTLMSFGGPASAKAVFQTPEFINDLQEQRYKSLINELRCLVCQNQTIADSDADLANQLRREVHAMILDGRSDQEIISFMVERYGDFVLFRPPVTALTSLLWYGPFLFLGLGLAYLFMQIRKRARVSEATQTSEQP